MTVLTMALIDKLDDCKKMLDILSDEQYVLITPYQASPHKSHSSVGQHTRHIIEFIETLLYQQETQIIDYDQRQRNQEIEQKRDVASMAILKLQKELNALKEVDLNAEINAHEAVHVTEDLIPVKSSFGREILFAISHTEHHFALISGQCDAMGVALFDNFGKAVSTLRHELKTA